MAVSAAAHAVDRPAQVRITANSGGALHYLQVVVPVVAAALAVIVADLAAAVVTVAAGAVAVVVDAVVVGLVVAAKTTTRIGCP